MYTDTRRIGEPGRRPAPLECYNSKRNSGQIGEVPRFCDSRIARHSEHRRWSWNTVRSTLDQRGCAGNKLPHKVRSAEPPNSS
ncbi:hypothetical protein D3C80_1751650 [compost metagenome]